MARVRHEDDDSPCFVTMHESELQVIAMFSKRYPDKETGGPLFGLLTRAQRLFILLAIGPGSGAVHRTTFFQQDLDYFRKANQLIVENYGLQWIGNWHKHPICLDHPSGPDERGVRSIARKNGFTRWCDIIVNQVREEKPSLQKIVRPCKSGKVPARFKLNVFDYLDPQNGRKARAKIQVIRGISTIRLQMLARGHMKSTAFGHFSSDAARKRILYDEFDPETLSSGPSGSDLKALSDQISRLPGEVQEKIKLHSKGNLVILTLPLSRDWRGYIAVAEEAPHPVQALYLQGVDDSELRDVTGRVTAGPGESSLTEAYSGIKRLVQFPPEEFESSGSSEVCISTHRLRSYSDMDTNLAME